MEITGITTAIISTIRITDLTIITKRIIIIRDEDRVAIPITRDVNTIIIIIPTSVVVVVRSIMRKTTRPRPTDGA